MTTIKSTTGSGHELIVDRDNGQTVNIRFGTSTSYQQLGCTVAVAELAAALGLVTREEVDALRADLRADLREADRARDAACDTRDELRAERDALRAELDEAEATIARVEAALDHPAVRNGTEGADYHVRKALHPKPAFVLPTEAGVRFTAKRVGNLAHTAEFVTISDGDSTAFYYIPDSLDGYGTEHIWPGDRVMREWTDHRLIGAES